MTTQAQIDAAARAIKECLDCYPNEYEPAAVAALTAAAEVGPKEIVTYRELEIEKNMTWNEAIERCAQMVDEFADKRSNDERLRELSAAMRAMKDKP